MLLSEATQVKDQGFNEHKQGLSVHTYVHWFLLWGGAKMDRDQGFKIHCSPFYLFKTLRVGVPAKSFLQRNKS